MVSKACTKGKKGQTFDWLISNDGFYNICNEMSFEMLSEAHDKINLYSC